MFHVKLSKIKATCSIIALLMVLSFSNAQLYEYASLEVINVSIKATAGIGGHAVFTERGNQQTFERIEGENLYMTLLKGLEADLTVETVEPEIDVLNHFGQLGFELVSTAKNDDETAEYSVFRTKYLFKKLFSD